MRSRSIVLALVLSGAICAPASADEMVAIDQGWSTRQKVEWYTLT